MIDDIIIKMKQNVIERCKERILESKNKPKNEIINYEEHTFTSKLKNNRGL